MTPVAVCFVIPYSKKAQAYFFVIFDRFKTSKQNRWRFPPAAE